MTHNQENSGFIDTSSQDGGILNMYYELPHTLNEQEVGFALIELDAEISGMQEPPVARVSSDFVAFNPENELDNIEDYRKFYVEFTKEATEKDAHAALTIVMGAIRRLSNKG